jgi:hypothetical protein
MGPILSDGTAGALSRAVTARVVYADQEMVVALLQFKGQLFFRVQLTTTTDSPYVDGTDPLAIKGSLHRAVSCTFYEVQCDCERTGRSTSDSSRKCQPNE